MQKRLLVPSRVRRVPRQFSWVDQRLVRDKYIERCDTPALALYLFLVTVADARGLSYYSDASIGRLLSLPAQSLATAREALAALAGRDAADEIERLREALRAERDRTFRLSTRLRDGSAAPDDPEGLRIRLRELEELISRIAIQGPDDLTLVRGIGPAIRDLLVSEGITTFAALGSIDEATLDRIRAAVPVYPERIERDRWIEQAAALARPALVNQDSGPCRG